jgi:hypothetical protein
LCEAPAAHNLNDDGSIAGPRRPILQVQSGTMLPSPAIVACARGIARARRRALGTIGAGGSAPRSWPTCKSLNIKASVRRRCVSAPSGARRRVRPEVPGVGCLHVTAVILIGPTQRLAHRSRDHSNVVAARGATAEPHGRSTPRRGSLERARTCPGLPAIRSFRMGLSRENRCNAMSQAPAA